jgi:hypothetical protein
MQVATADELESFHRFVGERLSSGHPPMTPEESVEAFRSYQRELEELRARLEIGIEQADRGEAKPLDAEALKRRIRDQVARAAGQ